jgi:hypothetical protein
MPPACKGLSWLLVVKSQIANLTISFSFGHNLCFKYPNGSCKPNLNIYISRDFQWYKEFLNLMSFDPCNCPLKIQESIKTLIPKMEVHLRVWGFIPSHSPTLSGTWNVIPRFHFWLTPSQALALVVSPRLGLWPLVVFFLCVKFRIFDRPILKEYVFQANEGPHLF